jgi:hypothetical protein
MAVAPCAAIAQTSAVTASGVPAATLRAQRRLAAVAHDPVLLLDFLARMPKGGDLHHHLTGAVYAESYIDYAVADGDCIDHLSLRITAPPCDPAAGSLPAQRARYFERAVTGYHLTYPVLKRMVRDSLEHAFVPGASLWRAPEQFSPAPACKGEPMDGPPKAASCRHLLARSERAALEWREEIELNRFEATL